jgi:hypothetical protein
VIAAGRLTRRSEGGSSDELGLVRRRRDHGRDRNAGEAEGWGEPWLSPMAGRPIRDGGALGAVSWQGTDGDCRQGLQPSSRGLGERDGGHR